MRATTDILSLRVSSANDGLRDYLALTKPDVSLLVLLSTLVGFYLASEAPVKLARLLHTLLGTGLVAAGTATLNQFIERALDGRMRRTAKRPLPAGRLQPSRALWFGISLSIAGILDLALFVNRTSSLLAGLTLASYLFLYTPLKTRSSLCTLVGAFPGAMPPLIGWTAAGGEIGFKAGVLYAILFLWQFPHFLAIAWMYREDYARAGILMVPVADGGGPATGRQVVLCSLGLLPVSLLPTFLGMAGSVYFVGVMLLGLGFLALGVSLAVTRSNLRARQLLQASILYLPLLFALLLLDRRAP